MATVVMKNRVTTEYRKVEKDSDEFWALRAELHGDGRPRWEQTGEHDLSAFETRVESGQLRDTDIGDAAGPAIIGTEGPPSQPGLDHGVPTPGELDQRAGRAAEMSDEQVAYWKGEDGERSAQDDFDPDTSGDDTLRVQSATAGSDHGQGFPAGHPPQVPEGEESNITGTSDERRIEEGVADDPLPTGGVGTDLSDEGAGSEDGQSYDDMTVADLKEEANSRDLAVERSDGQDGAPRKEDYVAALEEDDSSGSSEDDGEDADLVEEVGQPGESNR